MAQSSQHRHTARSGMGPETGFYDTRDSGKRPLLHDDVAPGLAAWAYTMIPFGMMLAIAMPPMQLAIVIYLGLLAIGAFVGVFMLIYWFFEGRPRQR